MSQRPLDSNVETSPTSRVIYVVLAILIGELGIHNFVAGHHQRAIIQLLVSILTCGMGAGLMWIWAIIEAFTVQHDSQGRPFS